MRRTITSGYLRSYFLAEVFSAAFTVKSAEEAIFCLLTLSVT